MPRRIQVGRLTAGRRITPAASPTGGVLPNLSARTQTPTLENLRAFLGADRAVAQIVRDNDQDAYEGGLQQRTEDLAAAGEAIMSAVGKAKGQDAADRFARAQSAFIRETGLPESITPGWQLGYSRALGREMGFRLGRDLDEQVEAASAVRGRDGLPAAPADLDEIVSSLAERYDGSFALDSFTGREEYLKVREQVVRNFMDRVSSRRTELLAEDGRVTAQNSLAYGDGVRYGGMAQLELALMNPDPEADQDQQIAVARDGLARQMTHLLLDDQVPMNFLRTAFVQAATQRALDLEKGSPEDAVAFVEEVLSVTFEDGRSVRKDFGMASDLYGVMRDIREREEEEQLRKPARDQAFQRQLGRHVENRAWETLGPALAAGESLSETADALVEEILAQDAHELLGLDPEETLPAGTRGLVARAVQESRRNMLAQADDPEAERDIERLISEGASVAVVREALSANQGSLSPEYLQETSLRLDTIARRDKIGGALPRYKRDLEALRLDAYAGLDNLPTETFEQAREILQDAAGAYTLGFEGAISGSGLPDDQLQLGRDYVASPEAKSVVSAARTRVLQMVQDSATQDARINTLVATNRFAEAETALDEATLLSQARKAQLLNQLQVAKETAHQAIFSAPEYGTALRRSITELRALAEEAGTLPDELARDEGVLQNRLQTRARQVLRESGSADPGDLANSLQSALAEEADSFLSGFRPEPAPEEPQTTADRAQLGPEYRRLLGLTTDLEFRLQTGGAPVGDKPDGISSEDWSAVSKAYMDDGKIPGEVLTHVLEQNAREGRRARLVTHLASATLLDADQIVEGRVRLTVTGREAFRVLSTFGRVPSGSLGFADTPSSIAQRREALKAVVAAAGPGVSAKFLEADRYNRRALELTIDLPLDQTALTSSVGRVFRDREQLEEYREDQEKLNALLGAFGLSEEDAARIAGRFLDAQETTLTELGL